MENLTRLKLDKRQSTLKTLTTNNTVHDKVAKRQSTLKTLTTNNTASHCGQASVHTEDSDDQ